MTSAPLGQKFTFKANKKSDLSILQSRLFRKTVSFAKIARVFLFKFQSADFLEVQADLIHIGTFLVK